MSNFPYSFLGIAGTARRHRFLKYYFKRAGERQRQHSYYPKKFIFTNEQINFTTQLLIGLYHDILLIVGD